VVHHEQMSTWKGDERLAFAYLANRDRHVERWQGAGGPWRPYPGEVPVAAMKAVALLDASARVRRNALGVLDHAANDESTEIFRAALSDPVPRVRLVALHGLSCERCRIGEIRVDDVVTDVLRVLREDASAKVRHAAIDVLGPLLASRRSDRRGVAIGFARRLRSSAPPPTAPLEASAGSGLARRSVVVSARVPLTRGAQRHSERGDRRIATAPDIPLTASSHRRERPGRRPASSADTDLSSSDRGGVSEDLRPVGDGHEVTAIGAPDRPSAR
jgi:hypothetical protein